jgi:DNA primase
MPDGALKMQLLGEIADLVQLTGRELSALWNPVVAAADKPARDGPWKKGQSNFNQTSAGAWRTNQGSPYGQGRSGVRPGGRSQPASRADHATRILLSQSALWDLLSNEDHALLCELPAPHGPLLAWLEGQLHEHGALPWESLRETLRTEPGEDLALRLMSGPSIPVEPVSESAPELRDLLNRMLIDRLKQQETEAIEASKADPQALLRYRELQTRRLQLEKVQTEAIITG